MYYDVESEPFEFDNLSEEEQEMVDDCSWLVTDDGLRYKISLHDEGFNYEDYENILRKASKEISVVVIFSDHKGSNNFNLIFGKGIFKD